MQNEWLPIATAPRSENYGSFLVLLPKNDMAPFVVLQVSNYEGYMYSDHLDGLIDYDDIITTATHWMPLPQPPIGE